MSCRFQLDARGVEALGEMDRDDRKHAAAGRCRSSVRTASPLRGWAGSSAEGPRERGAVAVPDVYSIPENVAGPLAAGKREMDEVAEEYLVDVDSQQRERQAVQRFCATPFCSMNCSVGSSTRPLPWGVTRSSPWQRSEVKEARMPGTDSSVLSWLRLLQHQRARGRTGLTVPFLIGAVRAIAGALSKIGPVVLAKKSPLQ